MKFYTAVIRGENDLMNLRIGLCERCVHMRQIKSDRESTFYRCSLSDVDPNFPKYPRLPVLQCSGYSPAPEEHPAADQS